MMNDDEIAQCRFTWNWEMGDTINVYAPAGPFPNDSTEACIPTTQPPAPIVVVPENLVSDPLTVETITLTSSQCRNYRSANFVLEGLPNLKTIVIGDNCFNNGVTFSLTNLPELQSVQLGQYVFDYGHTVVLENLPKLQSIQMSRRALDGNNADDRKTISHALYNYKNTLTMKDLPSLTSFRGSGDNLRFIGSATIQNVPQLSSSGISVSNSCFSAIYSLQASNADDLESAIREKSNYV
ncbi:hypothetical protein WA538_001560 [Blastocystis sp. DL]